MKMQNGEYLPTRRTLLTRLKDWDDSEGWREFFETYWKLIYNTARRAGLRDAEAQDVVQETVVAISRKMRELKYDPALGSFKGFLLKTTRWKIANYFNRVRGKELPFADYAPDGDTRFTPTGDRFPDPTSRDLDAFWEQDWQQNLVDAAIERVKQRVRPKQFQIFELYVLKEWPACRVASVLGVNRARVHLVKHRISKLIKEEVRKLEPQEG
jgi:RNA polymerase sigma factor (sigma-70 family)